MSVVGFRFVLFEASPNGSEERLEYSLAPKQCFELAFMREPIERRQLVEGTGGLPYRTR